MPVDVRSTVRRTREFLIEATSWAAGVAFMIIFAANIVQIAARPFNGGWVWVNDLSRLLFAWTVMLGAAAAYGRYDHIIASFLIERLSPVRQRVVAVAVRAVEVLIAFVLLASGLQVAATRMQIEYIQLGVPTGWAFLSVPALGCLILIFALTCPLHTPTTQDQAEREAELVGPHELTRPEKEAMP